MSPTTSRDNTPPDVVELAPAALKSRHLLGITGLDAREITRNAASESPTTVRSESRSRV